MTKTCRLIALLMVLTVLCSGLLIPASASSEHLSGSSDGVTLEAGKTGHLPFTISYPAAVYQPGFGFYPSGAPMPFIPGTAGIVSDHSAGTELSAVRPDDAGRQRGRFLCGGRSL